VTNLEPPPGSALTKRVGAMALVNRRYRDNERTWQRTSTLLKNIETAADSFGLDSWKQRQVALGMAARADLVVGVAAAAQYDAETGKLTDEAKNQINGLCKQAMDAAASRKGSNTGTAVHTATERLDLGETVEQIALPAPYGADLLAYRTLRDAMRITYNSRHIERSVRNSELGTVGTFDRVGWSGLLEELGFLAPGEQLVIDVKTEENPLLNLMKIAAQMADYAYADGMWVPEPTEADPYAGHYEPMPKVSRTIGLIIHVRGARARPILVDLTKGIATARRAAEQRDASREAKLNIGEPGAWAFPVDVPLPPAAEVVQSAVAQGPNGYATPAPGPQYALGDQVTVGGITFTKHAEFPEAAQVADEIDGLRGQLIEAIAQADSLTILAGLYESAQQHGIRWDGRVATAGTARGGIIECPQRAMHDPATTAKCACGWERGMAP
jgi:hypothetical protein